MQIHIYFIFITVGRDVTIWLLLHHLLPPNSRVVTKVKGKSQTQKFTIIDAQNSFFLQARNARESAEKIEKLMRNRTNIQPFVIVIGESHTEPTQYVVYVDNIKFVCESVGKAIDACLKAFFVLSLKYPLASASVWQFVQNYFYEIRTPNDKILPANSQLIKKLKK